MIVIYGGAITVDPRGRDRYVELRIEQSKIYRREPGVICWW